MPCWAGYQRAHTQQLANSWLQLHVPLDSGILSCQQPLTSLFARCHHKPLHALYPRYYAGSSPQGLRHEPPWHSKALSMCGRCSLSVTQAWLMMIECAKFYGDDQKKTHLSDRRNASFKLHSERRGIRVFYRAGVVPDEQWATAFVY